MAMSVFFVDICNVMFNDLRASEAALLGENYIGRP
jgi:hypothetical protein